MSDIERIERMETQIAILQDTVEAQGKKIELYFGDVAAIEPDPAPPAVVLSNDRARLEAQVDDHGPTSVAGDAMAEDPATHTCPQETWDVLTLLWDSVHSDDFARDVLNPMEINAKPCDAVLAYRDALLSVERNDAILACLEQAAKAAGESK